MAVAIDKYTCPFCGQKAIFVGVHDNEGNYRGRPSCKYELDPWSGLSYAIHHDGWGDCILCTDDHDLPLGRFFDTAEEAFQAISTLTLLNEPCAGLYGKYTVYKNKDGSLVPDCFVLHPAKDPAAVAALRAYAAATDNAELAVDIINWVGAEPNEPLTWEELREMDEPTPVWWERAGYWCLCERGFIITPNGNIYEFEENDWTFYRRPLEEVLKDGKE